MQELIDRAKNGDEAAKSQLLAKLRPLLRQWAEEALRSRSEARVDVSSITQETLIDVWKKFDQFMGKTEESFLSWARLALNRDVIDAVRSVGKNLNIHSIDIPHRDAREPLADKLVGDEASPGRGARLAELAEALRGALGELTNEQAQAVTLYYFEQLSVAEVAEKVGKSPAATAKIIQRGIQALRDRWPRKSSDI